MSLMLAIVYVVYELSFYLLMLFVGAKLTKQWGMGKREEQKTLKCFDSLTFIRTFVK